MSKRMMKVVLLVALLAALVASGSTAFGRSTGCRCQPPDLRKLVPPGGCHFDQSTSQCVNVSCQGSCALV